MDTLVDATLTKASLCGWSNAVASRCNFIISCRIQHEAVCQFKYRKNKNKNRVTVCLWMKVSNLCFCCVGAVNADQNWHY